MRLSTLGAVARTCVTDPRALLAPKRYVFLLSHMRSYSTLLAHILGSHPEIAGHFERLAAYAGWPDLVRARFTEAQSGTPSSYRYLLDKLLHNEYRLDGSILDRDDVRLVVFLRRPADALPSMVRLTRMTPLGDRFEGLPRLTEYYRARMDGIIADASHASHRPIYFDAEAIVDTPDALLAELSTWLELSAPLSPEYQVFDDTGERFRGDVSPRITQGRIVKKSRSEAPVEVPPDLLAEAEKAYRQARERILEVCEPILAS
ncbi:MAG: sulfotransferase [Gemmatimonadota bacterium]